MPLFLNLNTFFIYIKVQVKLCHFITLMCKNYISKIFKPMTFEPCSRFELTFFSAFLLLIVQSDFELQFSGFLMSVPFLSRPLLWDFLEPEIWRRQINGEIYGFSRTELLLIQPEFQWLQFGVLQYFLIG